MRRRIGIVFQDFRLLDHMTTYENVALPFRVMGREENTYRYEVIELLQWVGLGDRMWALPPVLSGGEKQRAAIARAVIARPHLLLADEPTGNVDPSLGKRLLHLFQELNKSGTSIVIATHDIALMDQFDARRLVLHGGRLHLYRMTEMHMASRAHESRSEPWRDATPRLRRSRAPREALPSNADRAAAVDRRPRAGRGGRDHDLPRIADDRRGHAGARQCRRLADRGRCAR